MSRVQHTGPATSLWRLSQEPIVMLSTPRLLALLCLLTAPLAPGAAQGWIEPMDANQARAIYEDIVRRKRDPALIELAGHGLLRARVFPIAPGETRKITLRYTQMLDRVGDAWRFLYGAGSGPGIAPSRSLGLQVDSAGRFGEPYSPTHRVNVTRDADRLEITLADTSARGDLELF